MKITDYASELTKKEGLKKSVSVAQIAEILKLINKDFFGVFYILIKLRRKRDN